MKPPAFQFYAADFMMGTFAMTAEEVGAYIRLLCVQWDNGSIPDDDVKICRLAGCSMASIPAVRSKFEAKAGALKNRRLEVERIKQAEYRAAQSDNGRIGAAKRWHGDVNGGAMTMPIANTMAKDGSPSPSPSPVSVHDLRSDLPAKPSAPRVRNPEFDALATACGCNPSGMTSRDARACGVALAEIMKATPGITLDEFGRRATNYRAHYRSAALTPSALCSHWAACDKAPIMQSTSGRAGWL